MYRFFLMIFLMPVLMTACARQQLQQTVTLDKFQQEASAAPEDGSNEYARQGTLTPVQATADDSTISDYILGPGDLITVTVFETDQLNAEVRVSSRGEVSLPLIGEVYVQDLTTSEAENKIEKALIKKYMHTAHVALFIKERMSQHITLVGAVNRPGTFETKARKGLLEILALAGGLSSSAGETAYITRKNNEGKGNKVFLVDLKALLTKGRMDMNMLIHGGDVIFVPQSDLVQVDGAVRRPGSFKIDGKMTIDGAIAAAGGIAMYADDEDIKLIRKNQEGKREILQLSMADIISTKNENSEGSHNLAHNLLLRDGDIIFVEASGSRTFYSGVGFSLGFLGTGVNYKSPVQ